MDNLYKLGIKTGVVPNGGWRYIQPTKHGDVKIPTVGSLKSAKELVRRVRDFRIQNHIDTEYVEQDIADWLMENVPDCKLFPKQQKAERTRQKTPLISIMRDRLKALGGEHPRRCSLRTAKERAEICATCPQNVKWETDCVPCNDELRRLGQNLRQVPITDFDDTLRGCRLHGVLLMAAVFLDTDLPKRHEEAPQPCWIP